MAQKYSLVTTLILNNAGYDANLAKSSRATKEYAASVQGFTSKAASLATGIASMAGGFLAINGAAEITKGIFLATSASADEFEKMLSAAKFSMAALFTTMNQGDWSNLIDNLTNAAERGREYADALDEIQDRKRSLTMVEADYNLEISKLKNSYSNKLNDKDKRIADLREVIRLEGELSKTKTNIANQEYAESVKNMLLNTKMSQQELENMMKNYNTSDELRRKSQEYAKDLSVANYVGQGAYGAKDAINAARERLKLVSESDKQLYAHYASLLDQYGTKTDATIDDWIAKYKNLLGVQQEYYDNTKKAEAQMSGLILGIGANEEQQKKALDKEKEKTDELAAQEEHIRKMWAFREAEIKQQGIIAGIMLRATPKNKKPEILTTFKGSRTEIQQTDLLDLQTTKIEQAKAATQQFSDDMNSILQEGIASGIGGMAEGIGAMLAGGKMDWKGLLLGTLITVAEQLGKMAISIGIAMLGIKTALKSLNPAIAIGAGVALLILAGAAKAKMQQMSKFATGGVVGGYSYSGDKIPIAVNSGEMILTTSQQSKLFSLANGGGNTRGGEMEVKFTIQGDTLVGVLSNYNRKMNSIR